MGRKNHARFSGRLEYQVIRFQESNGFLRFLLTMPMTDEVFNALATSEHMDMLRTSHWLTESQWDVCWQKNLPSHIAEGLADYELTPAQLAKLLKEEKRGSVLVHQFRSAQLTSDEQLKILTTAKGSQYVYAALASGNFDPQHIEVASRHFRGIERLNWISLRGSLTVTDAEALEALVYFGTSNGYRHLRNLQAYMDAVTRLLNERPHLIGDICSMEEFCLPLIMPLAPSRLIFKREHQERLVEVLKTQSSGELLAFVANPVVLPEMFKQFEQHEDERVRKTIARRLSNHGDTVVSHEFSDLSDLNEIEWVLRRALPTDTRPWGRPHDLVLLGVNENLHRTQATRIHAALRKVDFSTGHPTSFTMSAYDQAMDSLADRFNLPRLAKVAEEGFWERLMSGKTGTWYKRFSFEPEYLLDPRNRPWSPEQVAQAYQALPTAHLESIETGDLTIWTIPQASAHVYMIHHLGSNTRAWQLLASLAPKHLGSLAKLVSAAKRLAK
jgi:hypothetical protein